MPNTTPSSANLEEMMDAYAAQTAAKITRQQYERAKEAITPLMEQAASPEHFIEKVCELMAYSFQDGINLTLETYGLAPQAVQNPAVAATATSNIPVHVFGEPVATPSNS